MKTKRNARGRRRQHTRRRQTRRIRQTRRQHGGFPEIQVGTQEFMHVNDLGFTQESISPNFTDARYPVMQDWIHKVSKNNPGKSVFNFDTLIQHHGIPRNMFPLEVVYHNESYYSCNNRRLCLLKSLTKFGFDGRVPCVRVSQCGHATVYKREVKMANEGTCLMDGIPNIERGEAIFASSSKKLRMERDAAAAAAAAAAAGPSNSMFD